MEKLFDGEYRLLEILWDSGPLNSTRLAALCAQRLGWSKSTTYTVLRKLKQKGAVRHEDTLVTPLLSREDAIREQGEELARRAGGWFPFLTAFMSGHKLTQQEAEALKRLIDDKLGEG